MINDRPYLAPTRIGTTRDFMEVMFYLELHGCPACGSHDIGQRKVDILTSRGWLKSEPGEPRTQYYDLVCPNCQHRRHLEFLIHPDPAARLSVVTPRPHELGGPMPSTILAPHELVAELFRCLPAAHTDLALDVMDEWGAPAGWIALDRVTTCLVELQKFLPEGAAEIPSTYFTTDAARAARAAHPEHFTRAFFEAQAAAAAQRLAVYVADRDRRSREAAADPNRKPLKLPPLVAPLTGGSFALHRGWLAGERGGQQLEIRNQALPRRIVRGENMTRAIFEQVVLDSANFGMSNLEGAELRGVRAKGANFESVSFVEASLEDCSFADSNLTRAKLGDATVLGCDFANTELAWSSWYRTQVTECSFVGARLHNAAIDHATFAFCDFRDADFAVLHDAPFATAFEATFVRCDLRGSSWQDRPLYRVRFIDCKLAGVRGTPYRSETVIERPDLSEAGDGSRIGTERDVYALWGIDPDVPQRRYTRRNLLLTPDTRAVIVPILDAHGVVFDEVVLKKSSQHAIEIRDPDDASVMPQITAALVEIDMRAKLAAIPSVDPTLVRQIIDECRVRGDSFEATVATLVRCGLSRDEAMAAMAEPLG